MAQTYHRWFILPMEDDGNPKYLPDERLDGYNVGVSFSRQQLEDAGYGVLLAYNDAEEWPVVEAWGDGDDAWQALNEIHADYHDSDTLADLPENVLDRIENIQNEYYTYRDNPESFINSLRDQLDDALQNVEPREPMHEGNISMYEHLQNIDENFDTHSQTVLERKKSLAEERTKMMLSEGEDL